MGWKTTFNYIHYITWEDCAELRQLSQGRREQPLSLKASESKTWLTRALHLGKTIQRDFQEGLWQGYVENLSPKQVKEWFDRYNAGAPPVDVGWILVDTGFRPIWEPQLQPPNIKKLLEDPYQHMFIILPQWAPRDVRRAILEVCAVKMPRYEREQLVGSYGEDRLYHILAGTRRSLAQTFGVIENLMRQHWYKVTDEGDLEQVNGIYEVIQSDPNGFLKLFK